MNFRSLCTRPRVAAITLATAVSLILTKAAYAAGSSMPWEEPLQQILESIEGPVAKIIAVIIIIVTGLTLAFGDTSGGFRRLVQSTRCEKPIFVCYAPWCRRLVLPSSPRGIRISKSAGQARQRQSAPWSRRLETADGQTSVCLTPTRRSAGSQPRGFGMRRSVQPSLPTASDSPKRISSAYGAPTGAREKKPQSSASRSTIRAAPSRSGGTVIGLAGHKPMSPVEAIRRKCLDCSGQQLAEVKLCEAVTCPLWPFRAGRHPYTRKCLLAGC